MIVNLWQTSKNIENDGLDGVGRVDNLGADGDDIELFSSNISCYLAFVKIV